MSHKKMFIIGALVVVVCMMTMQAAFANRGMEGRGYGPFKSKSHDLDSKFFFKTHMLLENKDELGLSDQQVETIENLKLNVDKSVINQEAQIETIKLDIEAKLKAKKVNPDEVNALIDQKYELKKANTKVLVDAYIKLKGTITEDQWKKFEALKGRMKEGRHEGHREGRSEDRE